ncbi:polysaccharide biosynthesis/export family protein [Hymenobacter sp. UV11]|uniref:polysaccharide biosynthesis/export family protein n=1 Tax=Hymenobacter sp. UV11 TaxID=1849735 RepID=UPI0020C44BBC|nr:polysaccharide biosynthesis/export family protein [Hymenobacter sp. UV11]
MRDADYKEVIKNKTDPEIQPDDLLSISVSSLNPESNVLFNNGVLQTVGSTSSAVATPRTSDGYLVNTDGTINFPVLGKVTVAGLTKDQVTEKLTLEIKKSVKNPIVNIRLINFKVTIVGEVARPSTFNVPSERINLIEALGLAGDLTAYGKRNNILVVREKDGTRSTFRINLESKDVFNSPVFYLQQNDIVYVEPVKSRIQQTNGVTFYLPFVSLVLTIVTALIVFTK